MWALIRALFCHSDKFNYINRKGQPHIIESPILLRRFLTLNVLNGPKFAGFTSQQHYYGSLYIPSTDRVFSIVIDGKTCWRMEYYVEWDSNPHYKTAHIIDHIEWLELMNDFTAYKQGAS